MTVGTFAARAPERLPGTWFEGSVLWEGDRAVGCRLRDRRGLLTVGATASPQEFRVRDGAQGPEAALVTPLDREWGNEAASGTASFRTRGHEATMEAFAMFLARARAVVDGAVDHGDRLREAMGRMWHLRMLPEGHEPSGCAEWAVDDLRLAIAHVEPHLATLDRDALRLCGGVDAGVRQDGTYRLLDRTRDPTAPLARAWSMRPHFAGVLRGLARLKGREMRAAVEDATGAALDRLLRHALTEGNGGSRRAADLGFAIARAMDDMTPAEVTRFRALCAGGDWGDPGIDLARPMAALPASWVPRGVAGWMGVAACRPLLVEAIRLAGPVHVATMVNSGGDWDAWAGRVAAASGTRDGGRRGVAGALDDVRDVVVAFQSQVVTPALSASGVTNRAASYGLCHAMLFDARTLRRVLEVSRIWHSRHAAIAAALPRGAATPSSWPAALPDATYDGIALKVLTDRGALVDEGRRGADPDGVPGLSHCVASYAGTCLSGLSRLVSVRAASGASFGRLSTAELTWDGRRVHLVQHRGLGNAAPPPEAEAALARYLDDLASRRLMVDGAGFRAVPGGGVAARDAGYDATVPGNWEAARDAWAFLLPGRLRRMTPADVARMEATWHDREHLWSPEPFRFGEGAAGTGDGA